MRILIHSYAFAPSVGGIETVSQLMRQAWLKAEHDVRVVTRTARDSDSEGAPAVLRQPSLRAQVEAAQWADVVWQNHVSARLATPVLSLGKPMVVTLQTWLGGQQGARSRSILGKRLLLQRASKVVSISETLAQDAKLSDAPPVWGNPFDEATYFHKPSDQASRRRGLVFVGRLVSDKGADVLLRALAHPVWAGHPPSLTIVGSGPEETALKQLSETLGLASSVDFVGPRFGAELAETYRGHDLAVVPSRWAEPFGIVALEAMACGCVVVGTQDGGLPEAIGPGGLVVPNDDAAALAQTLNQLLQKPDELARLRTSGQRHVARFTTQQMASRYLNLFESLL